MKKETTKKGITEALLRVQKAIPVIQRDTEAYKYKYATLDKVWKKVGKIINDGGFVVVNRNSMDGVHTIAYHESGENIDSFFPFSGEVGPQEKGKEITYGRRYNLVALFNIQVEDEDDDAQGAQKQASAAPQAVQHDCPKCSRPMTISKAGKAYCKGTYQGTCPPKQLTEGEQAFADSLDEIPVIEQAEAKN